MDATQDSIKTLYKSERGEAALFGLKDHEEWTIHHNGHWAGNDAMGWAWTLARILEYSPGLRFKDDTKPFRTKIYVSGRCFNCGEELPADIDPTNRTITVLERCCLPNGFEPIDIRLNISSGKMVFANDLRDWFKIMGTYNINDTIGIIKTIKAYEKAGMAHAYVGNCNPSVYQIDSETLSISASPQEEDWDSEAKAWVALPAAQVDACRPPGNRVGGIGTDLWWYSVADLETFKAKFLQEQTLAEFEDYLKDRCDIIDVKPGVYSVVHCDLGRRPDPTDAPLHYAKIKWVSEPAKLQDFETEWLAQNWTASQMIAEGVLSYPSLYLAPDVDAVAQAEAAFNAKYPNEEIRDIMRSCHSWDARRLTEEKFEELTHQEKIAYINQMPEDQWRATCARVADQLLCVNGSGIEWHPNGWGSSRPIEPDEILPNRPIPVFNRQFHWYDISPTYSPISCAAGIFSEHAPFEKKQYYLNESFRELAFNILQSVIRYGIEGIEDRKEFGVRSLKTARKAFINLCKIYPDSIPAYCQDIDIDALKINGSLDL